MVAPQTRGGSTLIVAILGDAFSEQFIGYLANLGKTVASFADFGIVPPVTIGGEILFVNELLGNFIEFDAHILKSINGGAQIEFFILKPANLAFCIDNTLLMMSLTSSSDTVGVPKSTG